MFKIILNKIAKLSALILVAGILTPATTMAATANIQDSLCTGSDLKITATPGGSACPSSTGQAGRTVNDLIASVVNILSGLVGALAVIMLIYAGFRYVTSGGSDDAVKKAKNTIIYALIGLVIVALSQLIVHFVLAKTIQASHGVMMLHILP
jgi:hypothetical protein